MTTPSRDVNGRGAVRAVALVALAALAILATACSSDSGSNDAAAATTTVPGAELQGSWTVDFTLDPTADNNPGDAGTVAEEFTETWTFTETADGCDPGPAGCLINTSDDRGVGDYKAVEIDGDGYRTDKTVPDDTFCGGGASSDIHSIRTFSVDDAGQLTGTFHQVVIPDDPATCAGFEGTYTLTGSLEDEVTTTTSAP